MEQLNKQQGFDLKYWMRITLLVLILCSLIYVGLTTGSDPCTRCKLKIEQLGDKEYTCREVVTELVLPKYITNDPTLPSDSFNFSNIKN